MTSNELAVETLVAALKHYGVRTLVLSPGMRNIPFVTKVENDPFFTCHSVVDERSAAFFALGLAQVTGEPVGLSCTSGTAASNYLSGMTEAFYAHAPVVAITADRSPYALCQLETQKIDQPAIFAAVTKKSVMLPVLKDRDDVWQFRRLLSEALSELRHRRPGPIHLNLPLVGDTNALWEQDGAGNAAVKPRFIDIVEAGADTLWAEFGRRLSNARSILVVAGAGSPPSESFKESLSAFCSAFDAPVLGDHFANFTNSWFVGAEAVVKGLSANSFAKLKPEIVITFGTNFQERIKDLFKAHRESFEHWSIDQEGVVRDVFKSQTAVFECQSETFFRRMVPFGEKRKRSDDYIRIWRKAEAAATIPELPFGQFSAIGALSKALPSGSLLHLSVLNAMRLMQFFPLAPSVRVHANLDAFGIDGCLPTFLGQAQAWKGPAFLVIGDLSFFYGMNALAIKGIGANVRIFLVNNGGAAEFHIPPGSHAVPTIDRHIGCAHVRSARTTALLSRISSR